MIRLSVTDLDKFQYWRESEDAELADLVEQLRGLDTPSPQMLAGKAFHKLFEESGEQEVNTVDVDGYEFTFGISDEIALPAIRELKGECLIQTPSGPVTLVGKVDALNGTAVHDYKLTERFDVERYTDSMQWRSYLHMFSAKSFVYDVFVGRYDGNRIYIYDYNRLTFNAYPSMFSDVRREVSALAEIVVRHVPEKIKAAA